MRKVRLGLVGCGMAVDFMYGPFFKYLENGNLIAVMDIDEAKARKGQKICGSSKIYTNFEEMLKDKDIQALIIATPTAYHSGQVIKAANAGKHILCEKPMCRTIEESDSMIKACQKNKVKLMVAFMKRFNVSFALVKDVIRKGMLGEIFEVRARWNNARAAASAKMTYRFRATSGGGFLQEDGSHSLDLIRWWIGDVIEVSANLLVAGSDRFENESVASVLLKHKGGQISTFNITMLSHQTGEETYEIYGTKGTLVVTCPYHSSISTEFPLVYLYQKSQTVTDLTPVKYWGRRKGITGLVLPGGPSDFEQRLKETWQYYRELEYFCKCVAEDRSPEVTGIDGRAVVEILNAAYLSSWKEERIKLPLKEIPDFEKIFNDLRKTSRWRLGRNIWWSRY